MIRLSAFADEISPDPNVQVRVLHEAGVRSIDLRGAWDTNVLDLTEDEVRELKRIFEAGSMGIAAIASPIGKTRIDEPAEESRTALARAIELAHLFETPFIRVFSFYGPRGAAGDWQGRYRDEVLSRLADMARMAEGAGIVLVHENEREIYGDTIDRCLDVLETIASPNLGAAFDPANFIQCAQTPYPDAFERLRPWIRYVHIKDATSAGEVVPAGRGEGRFADFLADLRSGGYDGTLALEPHLAMHGKLAGFSGPHRFLDAARALKQLLDGLGWDYA